MTEQERYDLMRDEIIEFKNLCEKRQIAIDELRQIIDTQRNEINRLQAEKQNLEVELQAMRGAANSYKAENERLKGIKTTDWLVKGISPEQLEQEKIQAWKTVAYKECIEKVKSEIDNKEGHIEESYALRGCRDKKYFYDSEIEDILDNLLKEITGE